MSDEKNQEESKKVELNEDVACDVCGKFGAFKFEERQLCVDCYGSYGSCCPEFGKED